VQGQAAIARNDRAPSPRFRIDVLVGAMSGAFVFCLVALSPSVSWSRPQTRAERAVSEQRLFQTCKQDSGTDWRATITNFRGTESDFTSYCRCEGRYFARILPYGQIETSHAQQASAAKFCIRQVFGKSTLTLWREDMEKEIFANRDRIQIHDESGKPITGNEFESFTRCIAHNAAILLVKKDYFDFGPSERSDLSDAELERAFAQAGKRCKLHQPRPYRLEYRKR
jgi:hypothetical protein